MTRKWAVEQVIKLGSTVLRGVGPTPPLRLLAPLYAESTRAVFRQYRERALELEVQDAEAACEALAVLAQDALQDMRSDVERQARRRGLLTWAAAFGDRRWSDCDSEELLDDVELELGLRSSIMATLDNFNRLVEGYELFLDELLVMTATRKAETTKVLDLAAGHGGFAITVAEAARRRGLNIEITASDLKAEYLEIGRRELERRNSEARVSFVVQDALDLTNLTRGQYDIITSTQSLHHFSPGVVVAMMRAAAQWAGGGVLFVDGCRSALTGLGLAFYGAVAETNLSFVHDGLISSRKFFMPQELELLARLACPSLSNDQISARWLPPGYCLVKMERW